MQGSSQPDQHPEPEGARFRTPRGLVTRRVRGALTDTPRSPAAIARDAGCSARSAQQLLARLIAADLALRTEPGLYARRGPALAVMPDDPADMVVGQRVLICLRELSRPRDIARRIGRSPSCTTGHLCHLLRRGLVVRTGKGRYALARRTGAASAAAE